MLSMSQQLCDGRVVQAALCHACMLSMANNYVMVGLCKQHCSMHAIYEPSQVVGS